jgi:hypothetical protein
MVVANVSEHWSITKNVSGGQTGAELSRPSHFRSRNGNLPHGFRQRDAKGNDHCHTEVTIRDQIGRGVAALATVPWVGDGHLKTTPLNSGGLAVFPARQGHAPMGAAGVRRTRAAGSRITLMAARRYLANG